VTKQNLNRGSTLPNNAWDALLHELDNNYLLFPKTLLYLGTVTTRSLSLSVTDSVTSHVCSRSSLLLLGVSQFLQTAIRPDILSPHRQLISLPIPCHVHWTLPYCQGHASTAAVCRKPCFLDLPCIHAEACMPGACLHTGVVIISPFINFFPCNHFINK